MYVELVGFGESSLDWFDVSHSSIGCASCAILISDKHAFLLADNRTYHFQAEDEKDMIKYVFVYVIPLIICICNYVPQN